jgi:hypothetical protein
MPRAIACEDAAIASLDECSDALAASDFDPQDEDSLLHAARWLRRLGNDRTFLGDLLAAELAERHREEPQRSGYGPQVLLVTPVRGHCFIRANIWPAADDPVVAASRASAFAYGMAHDHNFDFLTLGYFGPGYWSDYYEYDYADVAGWSGEPAGGLRFVERSRLAEGKLLHYRAHRDVHAQIAPDALSVSLNVMHCRQGQEWLDQYAFDFGRGEIARIVNHAPSEAFVRIAVALGGDAARDLAWRFSRGHPSDRMRLCAFDALAGQCADDGERDALWRAAEASGSRLVAGEARCRRAALTG